MRPDVIGAITDLAAALDDGASWTRDQALALAAALEQLAVVAHWRADALLLGPESAFAQRMEEQATVEPYLRARLWLDLLVPEEAAQVRQALRIEPFPEELRPAPLTAEPGPVLPGSEP